jgi:hypothetical protein
MPPRRRKSRQERDASGSAIGGPSHVTFSNEIGPLRKPVASPPSAKRRRRHLQQQKQEQQEQQQIRQNRQVAVTSPIAFGQPRRAEVPEERGAKRRLVQINKTAKVNAQNNALHGTHKVALPPAQLILLCAETGIASDNDDDDDDDGGGDGTDQVNPAAILLSPSQATAIGRKCDNAHRKAGLQCINVSWPSFPQILSRTHALVSSVLRSPLDDNDDDDDDGNAVNRKRQQRRQQSLGKSTRAYFAITDLDSTNGTWVNKVKVGNKPCRLRDGDVVRFGLAGTPGSLTYVFHEDALAVSRPGMGTARLEGEGEHRDWCPPAGTKAKSDVAYDVCDDDDDDDDDHNLISSARGLIVARRGRDVARAASSKPVGEASGDMWEMRATRWRSRAEAAHATVEQVMRAAKEQHRELESTLAKVSTRLEASTAEAAAVEKARKRMTSERGAVAELVYECGRRNAAVLKHVGRLHHDVRDLNKGMREIPAAIEHAVAHAVQQLLQSPRFNQVDAVRVDDTTPQIIHKPSLPDRTQLEQLEESRSSAGAQDSTNLDEADTSEKPKPTVHGQDAATQAQATCVELETDQVGETHAQEGEEEEPDIGAMVSCGICMDVMNDPVVIECSDAFCRSCVQDYFAKRKEEGQPLCCPLCRMKPLEGRPLLTETLRESKHLTAIARAVAAAKNSAIGLGSPVLPSQGLGCGGKQEAERLGGRDMDANEVGAIEQAQVLQVNIERRSPVAEGKVTNTDVVAPCEAETKNALLNCQAGGKIATMQSVDHLALDNLDGASSEPPPQQQQQQQQEQQQEEEVEKGERQGGDERDVVADNGDPTKVGNGGADAGRTVPQAD